MQRNGWLSAAIVMTVATSMAETPDFIAERLHSDGVGVIDLGVTYKMSAFPKTALVKMEYNTVLRGWDLLTENKDRRCLFAIWPKSGNDRSVACYYNSDIQVWGGNGTYKGHTTDLVKTGDAAVEVNYLTGAFVWSRPGSTDTRTGTVQAPVRDSADPYYLFGWQYSDGGHAAVGMYRFVIKTTEDGETMTTAHEYVPCCKDGRAAVYDTVTGEIRYPSTDGFRLYNYGFAVEEGATFVVTAANSEPNTLTLKDSATLVFDGNATLRPKSPATLSAGTVTVSLANATGKGRYVLIENLPADFDLSAFAIGSLPAGYTGTLTKNGTGLVLTIAYVGEHIPDAFGTQLNSDGVNWLDTGYLYKGASTPRTKRMRMEFYGRGSGAGLAPGPVAAGDNHAPFGFYDNKNCMSYSRYQGSKFQVWGDNNYYVVHDAQNGNVSYEIDYFTGEANYCGVVDRGVPASTRDAVACSVYLFGSSSVNGRSNPSVLGLKSFQIYETSDGGKTETLALDIVPCVDNGCPAGYDRVSKKTLALSSLANDFTCDGTSDWRLSVNGEVRAVAAGTSLTLTSAEPDAAGYVVMRDRDNAVIARGTGTTAAFEMPSDAVSVIWMKDVNIAAGEVLDVRGVKAFNWLTVGEGATLKFAKGGLICLAEGLVMPSGTVKVDCRDIAAFPGSYTLVSGVSDDLALSAFEILPVDEALTCSLERHGDRLVACVKENPASPKGIAAESITSDCGNWFDSGYLYKATSYPKTSRVRFEGTVVNYGYGPGASTGGYSSLFGYYGGGNNLSYVRFGGNYVFQMWSGDHTTTHLHTDGAVMDGKQTVEFDYLNAKVTHNGTTYAPILPSETDATRSYWISGVNGNNTPSYMHIRSFKAWEVDESGVETLACDIVPTQKNGEPGLYDNVARQFISATYGTAESSKAVANLGEVSQEFAAVRTICKGRLVTTPAFAPQNVVEFAADGRIQAKIDVEAFELTEYDATGAVVSQSTISPVNTATTYAIKVADGGKVAVKIVGTPEESYEQAFEKADVAGTAPAVERKVGKYEYEYMVEGGATMTFKADVSRVVADLYDATGAKTGSENLAGNIEAGGNLRIAAAQGVAYRVVRVSLRRPGLVLLVK